MGPGVRRDDTGILGESARPPPPTPAIYRHMRSQSRGGLRPSYADRFTFLSFALSQVK